MITPSPSNIEQELKAIEALKVRTVTVWDVIKWSIFTITCASASYLFYQMKQKTDMIPGIREQVLQTAFSVSEIRSTQSNQVTVQELQSKDIKELKQSVKVMKITLPAFGKKLDEINRITEEDKEQSELIRSAFDSDTMPVIPEKKKDLQINIRKL